MVVFIIQEMQNFATITMSGKLQQLDEKFDNKTKKPTTIVGLSRFLCGLDGTRTRDLRRDRAAF
jgi:hypothetical protein